MSDAPKPDTDFIALQEALAGRYSLERELGRGGMGVVYLAQDVGLDRPVAIKLLPPTLAAQTTLRERFLREARTAARLSHPNIVPIHVVDEVDDFVFFVMAFVEGDTLGERVRDRGPVAPREAARILREVSWALSYAHEKGVVHRDVKPDNILLEAGSGRAMVTDFGIAQVSRAAGLTSAAEVLGTPEFMSPEQASGEPVDGRSDLYSLGVVGHYMLTGELPFQGPNARATLAKQLTEPAPALRSVAPELPGALGEAVDGCLAKDPAERFQDGEELAGVLSQVLRDRKEIPAAIRVFAEQNKESSTAIAGVTTFLIMMLGMVAALSVTGTLGFIELVIIVGGSGLWALVPLGTLGLMARRLLKSGYDHDELTKALQAEVDDRRRALAAQVGTDDHPLDTWAPRFTAAGGALLAFAIAMIALPAFPVALVEPLLLAAGILGLGGGITMGVRHALRRAVPGERWLTFWASPVGRALFRLAGLGVERGTGTGGSYRPTEIAIGMAAERLFEELPRDVRASLGDLPGVVEALEGHAERMRERLGELERVEAEMEKAPTSGEVGEILPTGSDTTPAGKQRSVAAEVKQARAAAEERLREVVAALENLRLELLRLHAGSGTVESMTADLGAARVLSEDIDRFRSARHEVDELLGDVAEEEPEPDTPVPA